MNRKEYLKKWREDNKEHIRHYKKEYAKTHDSSFKKLQDKYKQLQQEKEKLKEIIKENTILVKDEYGDYQECNINPLEMKQKYDKQVDNWNKLKEYIETCISIIKENPIDKRTSFEHSSLSSLGATLSKMQELEQGSDSNGNN